MQTADEVVPRAQREIKLTPADEARFWAKVDKNGPLPDQTNPHYQGLDQCWTWMAALSHGLYGAFTIARKSYAAHRVAFFIEHGHFPLYGQACHRCDNEQCVRHDHLFDGTGKENSDDRNRKGRASKGETHSAIMFRVAARGDRNASRLYPERRPRGEHHWSKIKPECAARGDANGSRKYPERLIRGEAHPKAKLTLVQVEAIRARWAKGGITKEQLGRDYGVNGVNIGAIVNNKIWRTPIHDTKSHNP